MKRFRPSVQQMQEDREIEEYKAEIVPIRPKVFIPQPDKKLQPITPDRPPLYSRDDFDATIDRYLYSARGKNGMAYQQIEVIYRYRQINFLLMCVAWQADADHFQTRYPVGTKVHVAGRWKVWGENPYWRRYLSLDSIITL